MTHGVFAAAVGDAFFVGVDLRGHVVDGREGEAERADAVLAGLLIGGGAAAGYPDGRMTAACVGLGEDVVGGVQLEVLALEGVVFLLPHARDLPDHFVPLRACGGGVVDVEGGDFVAACAPPGAEFKASFQEVIQHGDFFCALHGVVHTGAEVEDAGAHMNPLGHAAEIARKGFVA